MAFAAQAQQSTYKNSVQVGIDQTSIDVNGSGHPARRYTATYSRHLVNDRLILRGNLGYINHYVSEQAYPFNYYYKTDQLRYTTADVTLLFDFLKSNRHALRLGGGPTLWHMSNRLAGFTTIHYTEGGGAIESISFDRFPERAWRAGFNTAAEYEYALTPQLTIGARLTAIGFFGDDSKYIANSVTTAGLQVGYRF